MIFYLAFPDILKSIFSLENALTCKIVEIQNMFYNGDL